MLFVSEITFTVILSLLVSYATSSLVLLATARRHYLSNLRLVSVTGVLLGFDSQGRTDSLESMST